MSSRIFTIGTSLTNFIGGDTGQVSIVGGGVNGGASGTNYNIIQPNTPANIYAPVDFALQYTNSPVLPANATMTNVTVTYKVAHSGHNTKGVVLQPFVSTSGIVRNTAVLPIASVPAFPNYFTSIITFGLTGGDGSAITPTTLFNSAYGLQVTGINPTPNIYLATLSLTATYTLAPPLVATGNASAITMVQAVITGTVDPQSSPSTTWFFQYGPNLTYSKTTPKVTFANGVGPQTETVTLKGLTKNTLYHFRLVGTNTDNTVNGIDNTFSTLATDAITMRF